MGVSISTTSMKNDTAPVPVNPNQDTPMTDDQLAEAIRREFKAMMDTGSVAIQAYGCTVDHALNIGGFIWSKMKDVPRGEKERVLQCFLRQHNLPIKIRQAQNLQRLYNTPDEVQALRDTGVSSIRGLLKGIAKPRQEADPPKTQRVAFTESTPTPQNPTFPDSNNRYGGDDLIARRDKERWCCPVCDNWLSYEDDDFNEAGWYCTASICELRWARIELPPIPQQNNTGTAGGDVGSPASGGQVRPSPVVERPAPPGLFAHPPIDPQTHEPTPSTPIPTPPTPAPTPVASPSDQARSDKSTSPSVGGKPQRQSSTYRKTKARPNPYANTLMQVEAILEFKNAPLYKSIIITNNGAETVLNEMLALLRRYARALRTHDDVRTKPPTLAECKAAFREKGREELATSFFDHYESAGWVKKSGGAIASLPATVRRWISTSQQFTNGVQPTAYVNKEDYTY